jgi:O-acetyl-ADP-ribose deacetylase (regulator of RNase III)
MLKYFEGTVFNAPAEAIVNTVNTTGAMGAGIALEFALRYPEMFVDYEEKCKKGEIVTGKVNYYFHEKKTIINFPTKQFFKYPSRLEWIEEGLIDFVKTYKEAKIQSVAFPKLGTSNGKLNWNIVKNIMEKYLSSLDIEVYICLDILQEADGKEKEMLDLFNNYDINVLANNLRLSKTQIEYICDKKPFDRFWKIGAEKPIKGNAYKKIFNFFYNYTPSEKDYGVQASLFD